MLGPIMEVRRHQATPNPIPMSWDRTSNRLSSAHGNSDGSGRYSREELQITAQLEGLSERIASLESFREK